MNKVFNVYVMSLQAKPYKDRMHYTIKKWHCYYHVSRKLACYLMWCNGCAHITGWNNDKPLLSLNNDQLHGCCIDEARARKLTFCVAQRVQEYEQDTECGMIYPNIPSIGCDASQFFDTAIAKTLEFVIKNESRWSIASTATDGVQVNLCRKGSISSTPAVSKSKKATTIGIQILHAIVTAG